MWHLQALSYRARLELPPGRQRNFLGGVAMWGHTLMCDGRVIQLRHLEATPQSEGPRNLGDLGHAYPRRVSTFRVICSIWGSRSFRPCARLGRGGRDLGRRSRPHDVRRTQTFPRLRPIFLQTRPGERSLRRPTGRPVGKSAASTSDPMSQAPRLSMAAWSRVAASSASSAKRGSLINS